MNESGPRDVGPAWLWLATGASGLLAVLSLLDGAAFLPTWPLAGAAVVGTTILLYRWGQLQDRDGDREGGRDDTKSERREREVKAQNDGWS